MIMTDPTNPTESEEFVSPLENYDPKIYDDPIERALAEENILAIQHTPFSTVTADLPIGEAVEKLANQHVACLLVEAEGRLVGVFSDRDVLNKVALEYADLKDKPLSEVMTADPVFVYESDCAAAALSIMAVSGFRHVPITDLEGKIVGIVSPQRVATFLRTQVNA
jgi:CBS domain-containing protein